MTFGAGAFGSGAFPAPFGGGTVALPWYRAGGAPMPLAAYQPKGAASLAASYVNLANPGTYNATPGVAPTWAALTGWGFDGATQWLTTGINTITLPTVTILVQFAGYVDSAGTSALTGAVSSGGKVIQLSPCYGSAFNRREYRNGGPDFLVAGHVHSGNMGLAGGTAYLNGASDGAITTGAGALDRAIAIGARGDAAPSMFSAVSVYAYAAWNSVLTGPQVAAVSAAMAAL